MIKNPKDATAKSLAALRAEVRSLKRFMDNESRYNEKMFKEINRAIYSLKELVKKVIGSV